MVYLGFRKIKYKNVKKSISNRLAEKFKSIFKIRIALVDQLVRWNYNKIPVL